MRRLVIFGASNIISDIFDCAEANKLLTWKVVTHLPEDVNERSIPVSERVAKITWRPIIQPLSAFQPEDGEVYILGPTTPTRAALAAELARFNLSFCKLVHPTAYVSPLATLGQGTFIGAHSVIAPGAVLGEHVFVNRGVTIGHDTSIGAFSRIQPGANIGGLSKIGRGVTVGIGATLVDRLVIGDNAVIGAGSVVLDDVQADIVVVGAPAKFKKYVDG